MVLEIECCLNVGVAYQGTNDHWEALRLRHPPLPGSSSASATYPADDVHKASRNEGDGIVDKHGTVENDRK